MKRILSVFLSALMLAACADKGESSEKGYVDLDSKKEEQRALINDAADFGFKHSGSPEYDEKDYDIMRLGMTSVGSRVYWLNSGSRGNFMLDTQSDSIYHLCNKEGCAHAENSPGCIDRINMCCPVASSEGIFFVNNDTVKLFDGTEQRDIYQNRYSTDALKKMFPDNPSVLAGMICHGGKMYLLGPTYYLTFDPESGKAGDPVELTDANTYSYCMNDEYLFFSNENLELFSCRLSDNKITKLGDKVSGICTSGNELYYLKWENNTPYLMHADSSGENAVQLIENCYAGYILTDKAVYYQHFREDGAKLYVYDLASGRTTAADLSCTVRSDDPDTAEDENIVYPQEQCRPRIIWNGESDKVYVIDDQLFTEKDSYGQWKPAEAVVMFIFKNGSAEFEIKTDGV